MLNRFECGYLRFEFERREGGSPPNQKPHGELRISLAEVSHIARIAGPIRIGVKALFRIFLLAASQC
jgi:hypothetical protein